LAGGRQSTRLGPPNFGGLILAEWPGSSLWVIGVFVGIDLLFHGWAWVFLALSVRAAVSAPQPAGAGL
jgi:hypothetical protein